MTETRRLGYCRWTCVLLLCILSSLCMLADCYTKFDRQRQEHYRYRIEKMFYHAYDSYLHNAFPYDELRPLTCNGVDTWGSYSLTLIDALDTLAVMGNHTEFQRVTNHLSSTLRFDKNVDVSVFETNIRVVGGLLAAHPMARRAGLQVDSGWPCSGKLLQLAEDAAQRLLPAFNTKTGMPYGTVNLLNGVPKDETPVTCTAGVATFILEFGVLSRLTGNPVYEDTAIKAVRAMWSSRTKFGLLGNHVDVQTGQWKALDAGIGAGVDSMFEYLAKGASAFQNPELMAILLDSMEAIHKYVNHDDWFFWVSSLSTQITMAFFQSLEAFWPGMLAGIGDIEPAYRSLMHYMNIWRHYGFTPEFFDVVKAKIVRGREGYPLRPELIESIYHLYRATKDPMLLHFGAQIVESIESLARVPCGYATVKNVETHSLENRMESFFLAETIKYLYLLFDEDNFIHTDDGTAEVLQRDKSTCVLSSGSFVFNTEAHAFDLSALQCCSADHRAAQSFLSSVRDNLNIPFMLGLTKNSDKLKRKKKRQTAQVENEEVTPPFARVEAITEPAVIIGNKTMDEYCACDIPFYLYQRICIRDIRDWIFYSTACPARFCPTASKPQSLQPTVEFTVHDEVVLGDPDLLSCPTFDHRFLLYGEINSRN